MSIQKPPEESAPAAMPIQEPPEENVPAPFICDCEEGMRQACASNGFYKEKDGKRYCVLHYPGCEKAEEFNAALRKKIEEQDFDFRGVWFPAEVNFAHVSFSSGANFNSATFSGNAIFRGASFGEYAYFSSASFGGDASFIDASFSAAASFSHARFSADADFSEARFSADADFRTASFGAAAYFNDARFSADAYFRTARFSAAAYFNDARFGAAAYFNDARFSAAAYFNDASFSAAAYFSSASFSAVAVFSRAMFKDYFYFAGEPTKRIFGDQQQLNFQFAHFEKPDRVSFHTLDLKPQWFVNVDSRMFEFTEVEFNYDLKGELESLKKADVRAPHRLLAIACRQLADNAETNHRYREASRLRHSSSEARRIERYYGFILWRLDWWYWLASGYGESVLRAFIVFVVLIGLFTIGYKNADFDPTSKTAITKPMPAVANSSPGIPDTQPRRPGWREAALYSFNVSILQKPEPKPMGLWGNVLVSLETVLGPAQAALLALALRRRFMR